MQTFILLFGFPDEHSYCLLFRHHLQEPGRYLQEGMYAACHSLGSSPLSALVQSGPNPPRMTEVARGGEICACIVQGTVPLYYNCKLF